MTSIPSQWKWVFNATYSKAIVLKSKNVLWNFFFIFVIYIKFGILWKKRWDSEVINFRNYRLEKAGFFKCLKSQVSEQLWTVNMLKGPKDWCFLITRKENQLKKLCFSTIWNFETICLHIDTQWHVFSRRKSECLMKPIPMQLSPNQKMFSQFFLIFPKFT